MEPGTLIAVGTNTLTFTGLIESAVYRFRVAAVNAVYTSNLFTGDELSFSEPLEVVTGLIPS